MASSSLEGGKPSRHIFAVICCVRSTPKQLILNHTSLYRTLYPSLRDTISPREHRQWRVRLYLCADDNDALFKEHAREVEAAAPSGVETRLLLIPARPNHVPSSEAASGPRPFPWPSDCRWRASEPPEQ